jgi:hypothetical protein
MTATRTNSTIADDPTMATGMEQEHPLAEAGKETGESIGRLAEKAGSMGIERADQAREVTADGLEKLASTVRRVGTDMETEQPMIANVASTAAEQAERAAGFLRETDARELIHTVEDVARRQPLLFVGGAFLLGVAASRFLKAAGGNNGGANRGYGTGYASGTTGDYRTYGTGYGTGTAGYGTSDAALGGTTSEDLRP